MKLLTSALEVPIVKVITISMVMLFSSNAYAFCYEPSPPMFKPDKPSVPIVLISTIYCYIDLKR